MRNNGKFTNLDIPFNKKISNIINLQKRNTSDVKLYKKEKKKEGIISAFTYIFLLKYKPVCSRLGILNVLGKVLKEARVGILHFCPSGSANNKPTYKTANYYFLFWYLTENNDFKLSVLKTIFWWDISTVLFSWARIILKKCLSTNLK